MPLRGRLHSMVNVCEKLKLIRDLDMIIRDINGHDICREMLDIERPRFEIVVHF